jgi:hypothetical protein
MIVAKKSGGDFEVAPAGSHSAVCVDVIDLGVLSVTFGGQTKAQHKVKVVWQIDEARRDGKPHQVSQRYTLSLHEKASLRKDLESWRGKPFTEAESSGFDLETLIGIPCMLSVVHNVKGENTYANVAGVMKVPRGMQPMKMKDYARATTSDASGAPPFGEITDDDVPF